MSEAIRIGAWMIALAVGRLAFHLRTRHGVLAGDADQRLSRIDQQETDNEKEQEATET